MWCKSASVLVISTLVPCANAQIISDSAHAFGGGRMYVPDQQGPNGFRFRPSFFDVFVEVNALEWEGPPSNPPQPGGALTDVRTVTLPGNFIVNNMPPGLPISPSGFCSFFDVFTELTPSGTSVYDTEILSLNLEGMSPIGAFRLRESPTRPSRGRYTVTPQSNGTYHIDSFFDIFTEISFDGGQSWTPADDGATRFRLVPTPGSAALLGIAAVAALRRRR